MPRLARAPRRRGLTEAVDRLSQGVGLAEALRRAPNAPDRLVRLSEIGERSSGLGDLLSSYGAAEEAGALTKLKRAADIAGPTAIVLLGGLIGLLFASVLTSLDVPI